jgi:outer membrane protein assembly factor BamB
MLALRQVLVTVFLAGTPGLLAPVSRADGFAREKLAHWHQWRGPLATGMSPDGDPPLKWDEKTNVRWKTPIRGKGSATPIVWGDRVFILTAFDTGRKAAESDLPKPDPRFEKRPELPKTYYRFVVLCLDRNTGKVRWEQTAAEQVPHEGHHQSHSYTAGSPTTDGRFLYVSFGSRGLYCYDLDGKRQWQRDLGKMHTRLGWGEGTSPVVHGDSLIHNWDHEGESFIVALDARTGETRWKADRDEPTSWSTPLVVEHAGRTQVIVPATNRIRSYDLATGDVLWECGGLTVNVIPSAVARDGIVYCMSGYRGAAALALPLDARGDLTGTKKIRWESKPGTPYVPSPLLAGDRLYFTQGNNPLLTCLDTRTGKPLLDRQRLPGVSSFYASPVAAGDRIYLTSREGTTLVIRQADRLEVLATNRLDDPIDASPAIVGKQIFLRGHSHVYCIEERGDGTSSPGDGR